MTQRDDIDAVGGFTLDSSDISPDKRVFDLEDDKGTQDLKEKKTLGKFLSNLTLGKSRLENTFTPPTARFPVNEKTEENVSEQRKKYEQSFKPNPALRSVENEISVGETRDPAKVDGHVLLTDLEQNNKQSRVIKKYTSTVLSQNRFTVSDKMIPEFENRTQPPNSYNPSVNLTSREPGVYDKEDQTLYSHRRLAHVGTILSARATGEIGSLTDGYNPDNAGAIAKALLPSSVQLGIDRVELKNLDINDILKDLTTDGVNAENFDPSPNKSWGQLNNPLDPYSGVSAVGMIALSLALVASSIVAFEVFVQIFKVFPVKGEGPDAARHPDGRYVFGQYAATLDSKKTGLGSILGKLTPSVSKLLGIRPTRHNYSDALELGLYTFFGLEAPSKNLLSTIANTALGALSNSVEAPGFNVVAARNIARSVVLLGDKLKEVGRSSNLLSGIENVMSLMDEIKHSKLIAAMNVFATLGDVALDSDRDIVETLDGSREYRSYIDSIDDEASDAAVSKSKDRSGRLAWAGYRTPSTLLIPNSIVDYSVALSVTKGIDAPNVLEILQNPRTKTQYVSVDGAKDPNSIGSGARLDTSWVEFVESKLDSEYVPFYFHDLRTNEIISFHAFLTDLTDDYSPSWENIEGYGRVDPVKIYKSTERSISLGFWIVATNHDDHAEMWTKINKLVTMVYPQYSQGRTSTSPGYQFVQPFSQIITSSPLIRLRIGDVIKSNYSKFNLSRLFGAGDPSSSLMLDGQQVQSSTTTNNDLIKKFQTTVLTARATLDKKYTYFLKTDGQIQAPPGGITITIPIPIIGSSNKQIVQNVKIPNRLFPYIKVVGLGQPPSLNLGSSVKSPTVPAKLQALTPDEAGKFYGSTSVVKSLVNEASKYLKDNQYTDVCYLIKPEDVEISTPDVQSIAKELNLSTSVIGLENLSKFLSNDNAVVRAFEATKGKGLAGCINSLNFDWLNQTNWEITPRKKSPMMSKVTISFSPIHDISPGIDHMGFNRAPLYPVSSQFSEYSLTTKDPNK